MTAQPASPSPVPPPPPGPRAAGGKDYQVYFFSELVGRQLCAGKITDTVGRITDIVFKLAEPYPEAVGILMDRGWGSHGEFIAWTQVQRIEDDAVFVAPPEKGLGTKYPEFVDKPGWILVDQHLMGKTILDMDGRRTEVVNDVHLLASQGRMLIIHVDLSFNGFLRRWHLSRVFKAKDQFVSWRYVQPLSLEDAVAKDAVSLSVTRKQIKELPPEDLADALEELTGKEQQAFFSALEPETAAEALVEAEPRTQRQLIADLRHERARNILSEMSIPQLADLFSVLPHEDSSKMMLLLPPENVARIKAMWSERHATAQSMVSAEYLAMPRDAKVGDVLAAIRTSGRPHEAVSYVFVIVPEDKQLVGVVDLRDLVLAADGKTLGEIMVSPVVSADGDDTRDDLAELFAKYHFRMIPVVDSKDHMLGVIHYNDIMKGLVTRARV